MSLQTGPIPADDAPLKAARAAYACEDVDDGVMQLTYH